MIKLLGDAVALIPLEDPIYLEESNLWLAQQVRQRVDQGIVKYRGPATIDLRVGDHVFFQAYCGTKITVDGEGVLIILGESDVDAIWDEPPQKLFPMKLVEQFMAEAMGEALIKVGDEYRQQFAYFLRILESRFKDYEYEKGHEF